MYDIRDYIELTGHTIDIFLKKLDFASEGAVTDKD